MIPALFAGLSAVVAAARVLPGVARALQGVFSQPEPVMEVSPAAADKLVVFTYDRLGQLVGVNLNQTPSESYTFDPSGNLTSLTVGNTTTSFSSNNLNQQTAPGTHTYDAKGQKTTLDGKTFEWDDQGRVTAIVQGTTRSEFAYDGMSRRAKITELSNGTVTSKKLYFWLGGTIVCERDGLVSGFPITKRYFGQGVLQGTTKLFYTFDHLGSIRELIDSSGVVQAVYRYSTYGERAKLSGNLESDWGYAGLWHHAPSGLDLATYRLYDAANKRWISRDPLGEGVDYNLYRYCGNDPVSNIDPMGLELIPFDSTGDVIINSGGPFDSSREDVEKVKCSLGKIFKTKRGKELRKRFSRSNPWRINLNSTSPSSGADYLPTQTAVLDAGKKNAKLLGTDLNVSSEPDPNNISPRLNRNNLQLTAPYPSQERILAHELGHAATLSGEDAAISAEDAIMNDPAMGNTDPGYRWPTFTGHAR